MTVDSSEVSNPAVPPLQPAHGRPQGSFVPIILLTLIAVAAGAAAMYFVMVYRPKATAAEKNRNRLMHMTGMDRPVVNALDARFADADKDMIADAPADPKQLVDPAKIVFCYVATEDPSEY